MKPITMLIADDEPSICEGLRHAIHWEDYDITIIATAYDGEKALEIIRDCRPQIALVDIKMPKYRGDELIEKVSMERIDTQFIILSGYDDFKYTQRAIQYGVKSYLLKPIKPDDLISAIRKVTKEIRSKMESKKHNSALERKVTVATKAMREKFFLDLVRGEYMQERAIEAAIRDLDIPLKNAPLTAVVFEYDEPTGIDGFPFRKTEAGMLKVALCNIVAEILGIDEKNTFETGPNNIAAVFNLTGTKKRENVEELCCKCARSIKKYILLDVYSGIGKTAESLAMTPESFRSATEAGSCRMYETGQVIFDSEKIDFEAPNISAKDINCDRIVDLILLGERDEIVKELNDFFSSLIYIRMPDPSFVKGMCAYLVMNIQEKLAAFLETDKSLTKETPYTIISAFTTYNQIKEWITDTVLSYIDYVRVNGKKQQDPIVENAKAYINSHLERKHLLEEVSAYVHLSPNYFATYFKSKTDENFRNYVMELKIARANELLKTTQNSISQIADMLGYDDYHSFYRAYKKYTGKMPSEIYDVYHND